MRLIAMVPVKNEAWILPTTLGSFQQFFLGQGGGAQGRVHI